MRSITALLFSLLTGATLVHAQSDDYSGLRVFEAGNLTNGAPTPLTCGTPFSCTPDQFSVAPGAGLGYIVFGELGGLYVLVASIDTGNLGCLNFGIPGLVHNLSLNPNAVVTLVVGTTATDDQGRCNGGMAFITQPFITLPTWLPPGSIAFQAIATTPLSAGGSGFAFSNTVQANY